MTKKADPELAELYIHLYFDEDVSLDVVNNLSQRGFDVVCARDAKMLRKSDESQLHYAVSVHRTILTHNRDDFEEEHKKFLAQGLKHYGIIIAKQRSAEAIVARLLKLLNEVTAEDIENNLRYI